MIGRFLSISTLVEASLYEFPELYVKPAAYLFVFKFEKLFKFSLAPPSSPRLETLQLLLRLQFDGYSSYVLLTEITVEKRNMPEGTATLT